MEIPSGASWQDHLLSDLQLSELLASLDTETAMQVLQRQLEIRATTAPAPSVPEIPEISSTAPADLAPEPENIPAPPAHANPSANVPSFSFPWDTGVSAVVPESAASGAAAEPAAEPVAAISEAAAEREAFIQSLEAIDAPKVKSEPKPSIWDETASQPIVIAAEPEIQHAPAMPEPVAEVVAEPLVEVVPEPVAEATPVLALEPEPVAEPSADADLEHEPAAVASAEQAVTEYEEEHQLIPQPNLVDQVILEVGGVDDDIVSPEPAIAADSLTTSAENFAQNPIAEPLGAAAAAAIAEPLGAAAAAAIAEPKNNLAEPKTGITEISSTDADGHRPSISLLATWNGSGALLGLGVIGYLSGTSGLALSTLAVGAFMALVLTGVGFSVAALAARRGRASQQVLSRAAFGVVGNFAPATFMVLARLAATAVVGLVLALGLLDFTSAFTETVAVTVAGNQINLSTAYPILAVAVLLAFGLSLIRGQARFVLSLVYAAVSVLAAIALTVLGYLNAPEQFVILGSANGAQALGIASSVMVLLGLLWGSAAVDENLDLRRGTLGAKLLANGIFNWIFIGGLALVSGYALTKVTLSPALEFGMLLLYCALMIGLLANLIARNAAALSGLGINKVGVGSHLIVVFITLIVSVALLLRLGTDGLWYNLLGYLPVIGVPVIAWLGIFGADTLLRRVDYHEVSLLRAYGFYGKVNWFNLVGWLLATAAGWGLIRSSLIEFNWLGYLATPLNLGQQLLEAQLGVWVALLIGFIVPVVCTIPRIRNQERETQAIEARRTDLAEVLGDIQ